MFSFHSSSYLYSSLCFFSLSPITCFLPLLLVMFNRWPGRSDSFWKLTGSLNYKKSKLFFPHSFLWNGNTVIQVKRTGKTASLSASSSLGRVAKSDKPAQVKKVSHLHSLNNRGINTLQIAYLIHQPSTNIFCFPLSFRGINISQIAYFLLPLLIHWKHSHI